MGAVHTPGQYAPGIQSKVCQVMTAASLEFRDVIRRREGIRWLVCLDRDVALGGLIVTSKPELRVELASSPIAEIGKRKNLYRNKKYGQTCCSIIIGIFYF
jgi:hypothetical protein